MNGAGVAPHSETVPVAEGPGPTVAGVDGEVPLVANRDATKLEVDPRGVDAELTRLAVADDFAGRLYDAPLSGPDAVYVHRGGAFTAEVRDAASEIGAFRVNPGRGQGRVRLDAPTTGKTPLARYLVDLAEETLATVRSLLDEQDVGGGQGGGGTADGNGQGGGPLAGIANALEAVLEAARRAAERAAAGDRGNANAQLEAVATRLERVRTRLAEGRGALPEVVANAAERRLEQAVRRTAQARRAEKL